MWVLTGSIRKGCSNVVNIDIHDIWHRYSLYLTFSFQHKSSDQWKNNLQSKKLPCHRRHLSGRGNWEGCGRHRGVGHAIGCLLLTVAMDEHVRGWVARLSRAAKKCHWFYVFVFFSGILVAVLGVNTLYSQVLFCWLGKGGQLGSWDFRPADFVDDVVMSTFPPSTLSGFLFIIRTSTWRKLQVGLPGCHFLDVSSFFSFTEYVKHFRRDDDMNSVVWTCELSP